MELSRALHLPSSIQWVTEWASELCLCTWHETVAGKWTYILLQYILCAVITGLWSRAHVGSALRSEVTAPSSLLSGRDQFLIGNTCVGARWRDDITISEHIPDVPRLLWWDLPFISLKAPVSWCPLSTVHGQSTLRPRESERVVECYWLLWSLKITEFHWCCNLTIISFDEPFENVWGC